MRVFNEENVQELKRRYEQKLDSEKPIIYLIAVDQRLQYLRDEIEEMVATLPISKQQAVIPRLINANNFIDTYSELAVGNIIKQLGYQLEYDKKLEGFTPDWYVYSKQKIPDFIIEVFTTDSFSVNNRSQEYRNVKSLEERLRGIPVGATVILAVEKHECLDQGRNKQITKEIKHWLINKKPLTGTYYSSEYFTCELVEYNPSYPSLKPFVEPKMNLLNPDRLKQNIKDKIRKYGQLAMPLVLAVVTDPTLGEKLINLLVGEAQLKCNYNKSTGLEEFETSFSYNGLFQEKPDLTTVIWLNKAWNTSEWKMTAIYNNPFALRPLPAYTFGEDCCPLYKLARSFGD